MYFSDTTQTTEMMAEATASRETLFGASVLSHSASTVVAQSPAVVPKLCQRDDTD